MGKLIDFICKLFAAVAGVLLIVVTALVGYVILARAIHISSPPWVTQFTEYALLWITFLGRPGFWVGIAISPLILLRVNSDHVRSSH